MTYTYHHHRMEKTTHQLKLSAGELSHLSNTLQQTLFSQINQAHKPNQNYELNQMFATKSAMRFGAKGFARAWTPATRSFVPTVRRNTTSAMTSNNIVAAPKRTLTFGQGLAGGIVLAGLHSATGSQTDPWDYRFSSIKEADDLATFYGSEDFMELFCIFPFVGQIMMRNGEFDEKGDVLTTGVPGTMKVSMVFSEESNGNQIEWFNKRERFQNTLFGYTMWDMVSNFGFRTLEDGTFECYHTGEFFHGNIPIISQLVLTVFKVHARWLAWSTEHHINHYAFTANTEEEEEWEEESRKNMPVFLLKHFFLVDVKAMIFGVKQEDEEVHHSKSPSFLIRRGSNEENDKLPIQRQGTLLQISQDIAADRAAVRSTLARAGTQSDADAKTVLARTYTLRKGEGTDKPVNAYSAATQAARSHHMARRASLRDMNDVDLKVIVKTEDKPKKAIENKHETEQPLGRRSSAIGA